MAFTANVKVPVAVGVPDTAPVDPDNETPPGSAPLASVYVYGAVPPVAVNWTGVMAVFDSILHVLPDTKTVAMVIGDFGGGGMFLAFGVVCALLEAQKSGQGQVVDATMVDGAGRPQGFTLNAAPILAGTSGTRFFFTDQTGVIRYNMTAAAQASDPAL